MQQEDGKEGNSGDQSPNYEDDDELIDMDDCESGEEDGAP